MGLQTATTKLYSLLELERKAAGIKLVRSKAEYRTFKATELAKPLSYCVAVKCAMAGSSIKQTWETCGCKGASRALGLVAPSMAFYEGTHGYNMGLFKSETIASTVASSIPICKAGTYGVIVKPLEQFEVEPDVVLLVAYPRTIMRILQGYTYQYGLASGMHMSGNQAVCVECTVTSMKTDALNVSMLCSGTRYSARWKDTECMVGIAFNRFFGTVQGIERTLNAVEPDMRKKRIDANLGASNLLGIEIEYGKTYFKKK